RQQDRRPQQRLRIAACRSGDRGTLPTGVCRARHSLGASRRDGVESAEPPRPPGGCRSHRTARPLRPHCAKVQLAGSTYRPPLAETQPGASFIFAFRALPVVLVISALATLLFYWGILQRIVQAFAWVLRRSVGVGGPLGLGAAVHIFVGHIEAPLLIRPYLLRMTRGELFALMSCGMAGIAGTVMVLYASLLGQVIPDALGNVLIAAVISTPAALALAALMVPFRPDP